MKKAVYPLIACLIICCDQISKFAVRSAMAPGDRIPILGDRFSIYYVQNTGTAFSMFEGNRFVTVILTSLLIAACIIYAVREIKSGHKAMPALLICIAAGGTSNLADRLALGYVTDMISCGSFAVFNVADMFITCSCILMMIMLLVGLKKGEDI